MQYSKIEEMFETEETMKKLLDMYEESHFSRLDNISQLFRSGALADVTVLNSTLDELTGIYIDLNTVYTLAVTYKENLELKYYMSRKIEIEKEGGKFVSASTEKEASEAVSNYRRVRNIFQAKVEAVEKAITTCQSKLRFLSREYDLTK